MQLKHNYKVCTRLVLWFDETEIQTNTCLITCWHLQCCLQQHTYRAELAMSDDDCKRYWKCRQLLLYCDNFDTFRSLLTVFFVTQMWLRDIWVFAITNRLCVVCNVHAPILSDAASWYARWGTLLTSSWKMQHHRCKKYCRMWLLESNELGRTRADRLSTYH